MCGRFCLDATAEQIQQYFKLKNSAAFKPRYNIAPSQPIPVIRTTGQLDFLTWGLRPAWLKPDQKPFINARLETITQKPAFKTSFQKRRCLIIATGYYEWKEIGNRKQPYFISLPGRQLLAFAGIWVDDTCAIITKEAQPQLANLHARMPLIVDHKYFDFWLDPNISVQQLQKTSLETKADFITAPVSPQVNSPKFDSVECIHALQ